MKKTVIYSSLFAALFLAACQSNQTQNEEAPAPSSSQTSASESQSSSAQSASSSNDQSQNSSSTSATSSDIKVSAERAIQLFKEKYSDTAITSLELDSDWGSYYYKVEGVDNQNEYKAKIDANNEKMETEAPETLDQDEQNGQKKKEDGLDTDKLISIEEAGKIAVDKVGNGTATDWDLDKDLGTTYWEVKVKNGNQATKVKINSQSGEVLSTEQDD
ncbi:MULTISPECIES: PepSY domain-containing protein [unclassified Enterococcus]|uniref:PepSY domain-containing protein n=1 Tax=unclassified Enterococcus TaxID=2608891 RepID=UPI0013ED9B33|nr:MULTISPECIES: PepSY domain-containing protein [unclassified Enterococcus]